MGGGKSQRLNALLRRHASAALFPILHDLGIQAALTHKAAIALHRNAKGPKEIKVVVKHEGELTMDGLCTAVVSRAGDGYRFTRRDDQRFPGRLKFISADPQTEGKTCRVIFIQSGGSLPTILEDFSKVVYISDVPVLPIHAIVLDQLITRSLLPVAKPLGKGAARFIHRCLRASGGTPLQQLSPLWQSPGILDQIAQHVQLLPNAKADWIAHGIDASIFTLPPAQQAPGEGAEDADDGEDDDGGSDSDDSERPPAVVQAPHVAIQGPDHVSKVSERQPVVVRGPNVTIQGPHQGGHSVITDVAARQVVSTLEELGLECAVSGSAACQLYSHGATQFPEQLEILVLPPASFSQDQAWLKQQIFQKHPDLFEQKLKKETLFTYYKFSPDIVLPQHLKSARRCKVEILLPGTPGLPHLSSSDIVWIDNLPVMPFLTSLLLKLEKWAGQPARANTRDVKELLSLVPNLPVFPMGGGKRLYPLVRQNASAALFRILRELGIQAALTHKGALVLHQIAENAPKEIRVVVNLEGELTVEGLRTAVVSHAGDGYHFTKNKTLHTRLNFFSEDPQTERKSCRVILIPSGGSFPTIIKDFNEVVYISEVPVLPVHAIVLEQLVARTSLPDASRFGKAPAEVAHQCLLRSGDTPLQELSPLWQSPEILDQIARHVQTIPGAKKDWIARGIDPSIFVYPPSQQGPAEDALHVDGDEGGCSDSDAPECPPATVRAPDVSYNIVGHSALTDVAARQVVSILEQLGFECALSGNAVYQLYTHGGTRVPEELQVLVLPPASFSLNPGWLTQQIAQRYPDLFKRKLKKKTLFYKFPPGIVLPLPFKAARSFTMGGGKFKRLYPLLRQNASAALFRILRELGIQAALTHKGALVLHQIAEHAPKEIRVVVNLEGELTVEGLCTAVVSRVGDGYHFTKNKTQHTRLNFFSEDPQTERKSCRVILIPSGGSFPTIIKDFNEVVYISEVPVLPVHAIVLEQLIARTSLPVGSSFGRAPAELARQCLLMSGDTPLQELSPLWQSPEILDQIARHVETLPYARKDWIARGIDPSIFTFPLSQQAPGGGTNEVDEDGRSDSGTSDRPPAAIRVPNAAERPPAVVQAPNVALQGPDRVGHSVVTDIAARDVVSILEELGFECAVSGSAACQLYSHGVTQFPEQLEVLVLPPASFSESQAWLKQHIAQKYPNLFKWKIRKEALFYKYQPKAVLPQRLRRDRRCKVEILLPGTPGQPHLSSSDIVCIDNLPVAPFLTSLLLKLETWADHPSPANARDVRHLVSLVPNLPVWLSRPWRERKLMSEEFQATSEFRVKKFCWFFLETKPIWQMLGFEVENVI
ncbi:hypothetical protein H1R20_g6054, partial [Candolleomyces eurysporus]